MNNVYVSAAISFLICVFLTPILIPVLKRMKFGQIIRDDGPTWHKGKSGTPTMGGLAFLASTVVATSLFCVSYEVWLALTCAVLFGAIGFYDDYIKVILKRNLGLSAKQKFVMQILVSVIFLYVARYYKLTDDTLIIPLTGTIIDLGLMYPVFAAILMVGFVNSVNLTDGLDGLASCVTLIVAGVLAAAAVLLGKMDAAAFSAAVAGGLAAFLIFNIYPAKVFMGDTGSLFLGGAVSVIAIILKMEWSLFVVGAIYFIEALSVIIQVLVFKRTGKRVFLMSPIHHHFEKKGWKEQKIVILFSGITFVMGMITLLLVYSMI